MPILGVIDSGKSGHLSTNNYSSIQTVTVGSGGASSITFSSIPSTYTHLHIRGIMRDNEASYSGQTYLTVNSYAAGLTSHQLFGDGSNASSSNVVNSSVLYIGNQPAATTPSNMFNAMIIDILDYNNTNKYKTTRSLVGWDNNGASTGQNGGTIHFASGLIQNTSAVTSITIRSNGTLSQYSQIALYGVK